MNGNEFVLELCNSNILSIFKESFRIQLYPKYFSTLRPLKWLVCNSTLNPFIKHLSYHDKGNDHQLQKLLIVKQILPVNTLWKV